MRRIITILFLTLLTQPLLSQESLSLRQAIELCLVNNYDITLTEKNVEISKNLNNEGESGRWPTLSFGLDAQPALEPEHRAKGVRATLFSQQSNP